MQLYEESIRINENILGENHVKTADSYNDLEILYASEERYEKAEKSLGICERVLGKEHPETATSYNNLVEIYSSQEKYGLTLSYIIKAYKICINKLGFDHLHTKITRKNMEILYAG